MKSIPDLGRINRVTILLMFAAISVTSTLPGRADTLFWAGSDAHWHQASNWEDVFFAPAADYADSFDIVFVNGSHGGVDRVELDDYVGQLDGLILQDGYLIDTNGHGLFAYADTLIQGSGSEIRANPRNVGSAESFRSKELHIELGGLLSLRGSLVKIDELTVLDSGGSIRGFGEILFDYFGSGIVLQNDGTIGLDDAGGSGGPYELTLTTANGGELDLDGSSGIGVLDARVNGTGTLKIEGDLKPEPFSGTAFIGSDDKLDFSTSWTLDGRMNMEGTLMAAEVAGEELIVAGGGVIDIVDNSTARFTAPLSVQNGSVQVGRDAEIRLQNDTLINLSGQLTLDANSHLAVRGNVTIDQVGSDFDWDGSGESADTTVDTGGSLTIQADRIEAGTGSFHGELTIRDGRLDVQTTDAWRKVGLLTMENDTSHPNTPRLEGSPVLLGSGDMIVTGGLAIIDAEVTVESGRRVQIDPGAKLSFLQDTTIEAGTTWNNNGAINFSPMITTIDGPTTMGGIVDVDGNIGGGVLRIRDELTLDVTALENDSADNIVDDTTIRVAQNGQLNVNLPPSDSEWAIGTTSTLTLVGQTGRTTPHLAGSSVAAIRGSLVVNTAPVLTHIDQLNFSASGQSTLDANLFLSGNSRIKSGHVFSGTGSLFNEAGGTMTLEDGADVDVPVGNEGILAIGDWAAAASVEAFTQTVMGELGMEIGGVMSGEFDQLIVVGDATLAGRLDIEPVDLGAGPYVDPLASGINDVFPLIVAANVNGTFDEVVYDGETLNLMSEGGGVFRQHVEDGLFRTLTYGLTHVTLENYQALLGDANGDLVVDISDFNIWNANKFTNGDWTTGDFNLDGVVDTSDFNLWNENRFTTAARTNAVPEPSLCVPLLLVLLGLQATSHRRWPRS